MVLLGNRKEKRKAEFGFKTTQLRQCSLPIEKGTGCKAHGNLTQQSGNNIFRIIKRSPNSGITNLGD